MQKYKYYDEIFLCYDRLPVLHYKEGDLTDTCSQCVGDLTGTIVVQSFGKPRQKKWDLEYRSTNSGHLYVIVWNQRFWKQFWDKGWNSATIGAKSNNWWPLGIESNGRQPRRLTCDNRQCAVQERKLFETSSNSVPSEWVRLVQSHATRVPQRLVSPAQEREHATHCMAHHTNTTATHREGGGEGLGEAKHTNKTPQKIFELFHLLIVQQSKRTK